jgi:hypothetical protein
MMSAGSPGSDLSFATKPAALRCLLRDEAEVIAGVVRDVAAARARDQAADADAGDAGDERAHADREVLSGGVDALQGLSSSTTSQPLRLRIWLLRAKSNH